MTLQIEKLTVEVARKANELEQEVTETQAAQIELDKTAEELKRLLQERHELYLQWQDTVENSRRRDELINETGVQYGNTKSWLERKKNEHEQSLGRLQREKDTNKETEGQIQTEERQLVKIREALQGEEAQVQTSKGQVAILENQRSAFATELANKRGAVANVNKILEDKMERLEAAKKKYQATKARLSTEEAAQDKLESANKCAETEFKESENMSTEVEKEIRNKKDILFKESQALYRLRAEQANLIGDISGTISALRNLQANHGKLKIDRQRQQELIYTQDFQIQQMERKVDRMKGVRSEEEKTKLQKEIDTLMKKLDGKKADHEELSTSNKQLKDEIRNIDRVIAKVKAEKGTLDSVIGELKLENEMARGDLEAVVKRKEQTLVQHDIMKLEIQGLREKVATGADRVYGFENRKYQLEMSMEEREKEIQVHKDILISELKAAEEERHKVKVELQERYNRVKNLRIKYEGLIQKHKSTSGEVETTGEHSQAYYVIKAAQEKEELQRYGDELDGKVKKCEKEIKALLNTLDHLKVRNKNYREKFQKGAEGADLDRKHVLEEQFRAASEALFRKRRDMGQLEQNFKTASMELVDIRQRRQEYDRGMNDEAQNHEQIINELNEVGGNLEQDEQSRDAKLNNVRNVRGEQFDESPENLMILAEIESQKNAYLLNALSYLVGNQVLGNEVPQLVAEIQTTLEENQIQIPEQPNEALERPPTSSSQRSGQQQ